VPDAKTLWRYRESLKSAAVFDRLFAELARQIAAEGYVARKGQIIDASLVAAPIQRNRRTENAQIKSRRGAGRLARRQAPPEGRRGALDPEARRQPLRLQEHVSVDREHKLIRCWQVSDAALHDSQVFDELLDPANTSADVWADSAYRSQEREATLRDDGWRSRIHRKGQKDKPLSARAQAANRRRATVRARVEHVFAQQEAMGRMLVRTIGVVRARFKIGMMNLAYNLRRLACLKANREPVMA